MASGANRGAYYAGFPGLLQEAGIEFELAGGIAAAWFAAGDPEAMVDSWRQADPWRIAPHPWLSFGKLRTVDRLIEEITLKTMDVRAARTAAAEVVVAAARVVGPGLPLPRLIAKRTMTRLLDSCSGPPRLFRISTVSVALSRSTGSATWMVALSTECPST